MENLSYFYFRFVWPNDLEQLSHVALYSGIIFTKIEVCQLSSFWQRFYCWYVITGWTTAGIAIIHQAILRWHNSRISVKFSTAKGTLHRAESHTHPWIFGGFRQKKREKLPKFPTFSPRSGEPLARCQWNLWGLCGNRSTKAINIWCYSVSKLGIYRQKKRDGAFSSKLFGVP